MRRADGVGGVVVAVSAAGWVAVRYADGAVREMARAVFQQRHAPREPFGAAEELREERRR